MLLIKYNMRSLLQRRNSTALTILSIAIVVAVFVSMRAMGEGLTASFGGSVGSPDNVLVLRLGVKDMMVSGLPKDIKLDIMHAPYVMSKDNRKMVSPEIYVPMWAKKAGGKERFVIVRGVSPAAFDVHEQVTIARGSKDLAYGEVLVGQMVGAKLGGDVEVGDPIEVGDKKFTVGGILKAGDSALESEIWMKLTEMAALSNRDYYSYYVVKAERISDIPLLKEYLNKNQKLHVEALPETEYYKTLGDFSFGMGMMGMMISVITAIGVVFGGMNTMYASVLRRTREIGTMRALGFGEKTILVSFMLESLAMAVTGGLIGCSAGLLVNNFSMTSMLPMMTVAHHFRVTGAILAQAIALCVAIGILGGLLPARKAAELEVIEAIRKV
jgi:putative ABC transport system permease protein